MHVHIYFCMYMYIHTTGDVESTEPTKMLMRIAEYVDTGGGSEVDIAGLREWFLNNKNEVLSLLANERKRQKMSLRGSSHWTPDRYVYTYMSILHTKN